MIDVGDDESGQWLTVYINDVGETAYINIPDETAKIKSLVGSGD